ncbi:MAG: single-stranded DNA-binding protein [Armatimonadetes bacterium]|nr:single-stranded DNA-binding protein [Armatimonadota bacterium]
MNEIRLSGTFATETALDENAEGSRVASFIIRVPRPEEGEDYFRVLCTGAAAEVVWEAAGERLLRGVGVEVAGRLAQDTVEDGHGGSVKTVRVVAETLKIGE